MKKLRMSLLRFIHSGKALAIPVTFLILFISTLGLISVTYYLAVEKVSSHSQTLKVVAAKQNFLAFDENIMAVVWKPGSARTFSVADSGGRLHIEPNASKLIISIGNNGDFDEIVYNQTIGQVRYELPYASASDIGVYLKGDERTVTNQSGSTVTQLCIQSGLEHKEIQLRYRPTVSCVTAGTENNRTINDLRIYVINMNASDRVTLFGALPLRISSESIQIISSTYDVPNSLQTLSVSSNLDGVNGKVSIPISTTVDGAIVNLEVVECNIKIERSMM